jgi:2-methylcitrate dehydratase PrpD
MTPVPVLARLAQWSAALRADALGDDVARGAARSILDTVGVGLAGAGRPLTRAVSAAIAGEVAAGPCVILGSALRLRPTGAALINGTSCHVLDFDDTCYDGIVHASCVILPAVLACAEEADASGADLLAGFVAGSEVTYVLGRALPGIFWQGWWTTSLLGAIGAAAGSARALGLDADRTTHAMALASCFTFGLRTLLGTDATPLGAGYAAEAGVRAALLARAGAQGPQTTFESDLGLARMYNGGTVDAAALDSLGKHYALLGENLSFKAYPACSGTQAAAQAVGELLDEHAIASADIRSVRARVMPLVAENLRYPSPSSLTQAQFSLPFAIGCQLRFGRFGVRQLADGVLEDAALQAEMAKVEMIRADDLVAEADRSRFPEAAEVAIELNDGTVLQRFVGAARGMPDVPMSDAMLDEKFIDCAEDELGHAGARIVLARLRDLGALGGVRNLLVTS